MFSRPMSLPAMPLAPGWGSGRLHLVDDPLNWSYGGPEPEVIALPSLWWPLPQPLPPRARALLLLGPATASERTLSVPVLGGIDVDILREGERVEVNGSKGTFSIDGVEEVAVVTAILERPDGRILLLERSERVGSFRGRWAGVSGFLEDPTPLAQAYREVLEEVGLDPSQLTLAASGAPVLARDGPRVYIVHPFRFHVATEEVRLDWESARFEWVDPEEIRRRSTVPKLDRVWEAVRPAHRPKP